MYLQNNLLQVSIRVCIDLCALLLGLLIYNKQALQAQSVHLGVSQTQLHMWTCAVYIISFWWSASSWQVCAVLHLHFKGPYCTFIALDQQIGMCEDEGALGCVNRA